MRCERVREELWGLVDAGLSAHAHERVEAHLEECAACREELEALGELNAVLASEPRVEAPKGIATAVARQAAARAMMRRRMMIPGWLEAVSFVGVGGAAAAVGLVGLQLVTTAAQIEVSVGNAVGVVSVVVAAGLAVFGTAYYRA